LKTLSLQNKNNIPFIVKELIITVINCFDIQEISLENIMLMLNENSYVSCYTYDYIIFFNEHIIKTLQEKINLEVKLETIDTCTTIHIYFNLNLLENNKNILSDIKTLLKLENKYQESIILNDNFINWII